MTGSRNLGVDVGTSGGDWLFRQEGLVLGPVPGTRIVQMLQAGEIDGRTEVAPMGSSSFRRLAEVDFFKVHYAKAEARRRVEAAAEKDRAARARRRNVKLLAVGGAALTLALLAAVGGWYLAIHDPFSSAEDAFFASITVDPPSITVARAHNGDEELVDYPGATRAPKRVEKAAPTPTATAARAAAPAERPSERPARSAPPPKRAVASAQPSRPRMSDPGSEPDGLQTAQFDQGAINAVVAQKQRTLYACFREEAKRDPGFAARIPLEFVIGNDGRVARLWVDNPRYKSGPLFDCLLRELQKWPFKPYQGERATVGLSFNIGKKR